MESKDASMRAIQQVIEERIRPQLLLHNGDIEILDWSDGVLRFRLTGQCAGCPSADLTTEELVQAELTAAVPAVKRVVLVREVAQSLLEQAYAILRHET
ncbi:MAG: NifU family protein [Eubacteriales bacterium]|nr:NifU family protein [Eubacteriales bacterium]